MPKLKLSGRKLCTTGRKLAVCGCGPTLGPCCTASFPCEITPATTPRQFKTWWNVTASGTRTVNIRQGQFPTPPPPPTCVGGQFSGTYSGVEVFPQLVLENLSIPPESTYAFGSGTCSLARVNQDQEIFRETGAVTGNLSLGGQVSSYVQMRVRTSVGRTTGWPVQASAFELSQNSGRQIQFQWRVNAGSYQNNGNGYEESNSVLAVIEVQLLDGVLTVRTGWPAALGPITPFLVKEGNCILGAGATFVYSPNATTCRNSITGQQEPLSPGIMSGSVATALCGLAVGCTAPGSVCASTTVPGAPGGGGGGSGTLEDQLDAALFS